MKLILRYGWRFSCGCEPPVASTAPEANGVLPLVAYCSSPAALRAGTWPAGLSDVPFAEAAPAACECAGSCAVVSARVSAPAAWPSA